jgi:hypothetical protein
MSSIIYALYLIPIAIIAINIWVIVYTFKLRKNKCECAIDNRLTFIQFALIFNMTIGLFVAMSYGVTNHILRAISIIIGIIYVIISILYIRDMRKTNCACSEDTARDVWEVLVYISAVLYVLMAVTTVVSLGMNRKQKSFIR